MLKQASEKGRSLKWRLNKIPGCEELVQKCRTVFWFNTKIPRLGMHLSCAPHCLQRDFIPVSIEQVRLTFAAELNHSILPCSVDQKAARLKGKLCRNAAWPVCQHVQERVIFHDNISPQKDGPGRRWHKIAICTPPPPPCLRTGLLGDCHPRRLSGVAKVSIIGTARDDRLTVIASFVASLLAMTAGRSGLSPISSPCWHPSSRSYPASSSRMRCSRRTAFPCRDRSAPARSPSSSARRRSSPAPWSW